jgi:hypothetical protein
MKKSILLSTLLAGLIITSCGDKKEEKKNDMDADVKKMCDCFEAGKTDSQKFMECSSENEKMREKYKDDNDALTEYDKQLTECMK